MVNRSKKLTGPFLVQLRNRFREIAGKDNRIDRQEFHESMLIGNDAITDRIFDIFDKDQNSFLDLEEFLSGFQSLVNGSEEDLIRFAFDIHDLDSSGDIDHEELRIFIKESLIENNLDFDPYQIDLLVDEFFRKADTDKSGTIAGRNERIREPHESRKRESEARDAAINVDARPAWIRAI